MNTITREQLKTKLEHSKNIKLIMAMDRNAYDKMHIPGSVQFNSLAEAVKQLNRKDEVIVYCTNQACRDSFMAYFALYKLGYKKLYRYAGGLEEWYQAGYPLEGSMIQTAH